MVDKSFIFFQWKLVWAFVCSLPSYLCLVITKILRSMPEKKKQNTVAGFDLQWKSTKLFLLFLPTDLWWSDCQCFQVSSSSFFLLFLNMFLRLERNSSMDTLQRSNFSFAFYTFRFPCTITIVCSTCFPVTRWNESLFVLACLSRIPVHLDCAR